MPLVDFELQQPPAAPTKAAVLRMGWVVDVLSALFGLKSSWEPEVPSTNVDSTQFREDQMGRSIDRSLASERDAQGQRQEQASPTHAAYPSSQEDAFYQQQQQQFIAANSVTSDSQQDLLVRAKHLEQRGFVAIGMASDPSARLAAETSIILARAGSVLAHKPQTYDLDEAKEVTSVSSSLLDLALSFTPIVGLGKDLVVLATRRNPVTGHELNSVEYGLTLACIIVPGALQASAKGVSKAVKWISLANTHGQPDLAARAHEFKVSLEATDRFLRGLVAEAPDLAPEPIRLLARAASHSGDQVVRTAAQARLAPGIVTASGPLFDSRKMLRGCHAGWIPRDIANKLVGRRFNSFDEFRAEFWKLASESKYVHDWSPSNIELMKAKQAPVAPASQQVGARIKYELHHVQPIKHGGEVYDTSNIMIVTPRFHLDVLDRAYHFGG
ncbi:hypothetical protein OIV83_000004 [Microbotryomycetes sp. JL201]|nr:hypothetical protein OIV83_000004 [Microbotryomycetes sp. JL201]